MLGAELLGTVGAEGREGAVAGAELLNVEEPLLPRSPLLLISARNGKPPGIGLGISACLGGARGTRGTGGAVGTFGADIAGILGAGT